MHCEKNSDKRYDMKTVGLHRCITNIDGGLEIRKRDPMPAIRPGSIQGKY